MIQLNLGSAGEYPEYELVLKRNGSMLVGFPIPENLKFPWDRLRVNWEDKKIWFEEEEVLV